MDGIGDNDLAEMAAAGDAVAFGVLVGRHYPRIHRLAWRLTGDAGAAEDVAQDVCVRLGGAIRGFRGQSAFTTWLHRVVVNAARDAGRRQRRGGRHTGAFSWEDVLALAQSARGEDPYGYRAEFVTLVHLARSAEALERQP